MGRDERELKVSNELLERLPAELCERIPRDWDAAARERSAAALEWRWAKNPTGEEDLSPFSVERMGYRPGRRRKPPAPEGTDLTLYGYDGDGRCVFCEQRSGSGDTEYENLLWHTQDESVRWYVQTMTTLWPPTLLAVWRARLDGGRPVEVEHFTGETNSRERSTWDGERLLEAKVEYTGGLIPSTRHVFRWQGSDLVRVECNWADSSEVVYERLPSGVTAAGLLVEIEEELVERIPSAVGTVSYPEPVCAMALAYTDGELSLPPGVVLCPDAVRRQLEGEGDPFWYRWQAAEWMGVAAVPELDAYGGEPFLERCRTLDRQLRMGGDELGTARLLQAVARRLNQRDWSEVLLVTEDFTVYAWEIHGESLEKDLAASRPRR